MERMFNELKEIVEWTHSKMQEDMRTEMRKLQSVISELKNLVGEIKNSVKGLSRVTAAEDRISECR